MTRISYVLLLCREIFEIKHTHTHTHTRTRTHTHRERERERGGERERERERERLKREIRLITQMVKKNAYLKR